MRRGMFGRLILDFKMKAAIIRERQVCLTSE
jgi:hypothetical protein